MAESPALRRPPEPHEKIFIDDPAAACVLDFANAVYAVLLRCLVQAFGRQGERAAVMQRQYLDVAMALMHVVARAATALVTLPASPSHPGEPLLIGAAERVLMHERLQEIRDGARAAVLAAPSLHGIEAEIDILLAKLPEP